MKPWRLAVILTAILLTAETPEWTPGFRTWQWEPDCTAGLVAGYRPGKVLLDAEVLRHTPVFLGVVVIQYGDTRHVEFCAPRPLR